MSQLLVKNGRCVTPNGLVADLLIDQGQIVAMGRGLSGPAETVIDAQGQWVLPGGMDVHVHLPWPTGDLVSLDDLHSGTRAAAFGGVTTVLDFVIPSDGEPLEHALARKLADADGRASVDYSFHLNIRGEVGKAIAAVPRLVAKGFPSFKVFMAYEGFRLPDSDLLQVMTAVARARGVLGVHAENGLLADHLTRDLVAAGRTSLADYRHARPPICESEAIFRVLSYARAIGTRVHIHHVSTAEGAEMIGRARREGMVVSGETCPHYLLFSDQEYAGDPARAAHLVCAPPIKSASDQSALWQALSRGDLSILATDHCPYSIRQKEARLDDFTRVPGGLPGVETRLPLILSEGVGKGKLTLERFVEIWATEPARLFGLYPRKGIIAVGSDADLVIVDPNRKQVLRSAELHMNSDCLPYEGWEVTGVPTTTILRGRVLIKEGQAMLEEPMGKLVARHFGQKVQAA